MQNSISAQVWNCQCDFKYRHCLEQLG